jgi:hypothetical protein
LIPPLGCLLFDSSSPLMPPLCCLLQFSNYNVLKSYFCNFISITNNEMSSTV